MVAIELHSAAPDGALMDSDLPRSGPDASAPGGRKPNPGTTGREAVRRVSLNTHTSILSIAEDDEDEEDEEDAKAGEHAVKYEDLRMNIVEEDPRPTTREIACCDYTLSRPSVLEQFLDGICGVRQHDVAVVVTEGHHREAVEGSILDLLGCAGSPDQDEIRWSHSLLGPTPGGTAGPPPRPLCHRKSPRARAAALHRAALERRQQHLRPRAGLSLSPISVLALRPRSLDGSAHDLVLETSDSDDGYDSDPEARLPAVPPSTGRTVVVPADSYNGRPSAGVSLVEETLNLAWALTYHAPGAAGVPCRVWMERGTLIDGNTRMLEPTLAWRPAVEGGRHGLATAPPTSIRLLNICRLLPADATAALDRAAYPLVRPRCGLVLRTAEGDTVVFQAAAPTERDALLRRWKAVVARFAALAVVEDMDAIAAEFFQPTEFGVY